MNTQSKCALLAFIVLNPSSIFTVLSYNHLINVINLQWNQLFAVMIYISLAFISMPCCWRHSFAQSTYAFHVKSDNQSSKILINHEHYARALTYKWHCLSSFGKFTAFAKAILYHCSSDEKRETLRMQCCWHYFGCRLKTTNADAKSHCVW